MNFNELREQYQTETGWLPINYVTKEFTKIGRASCRERV